MDELSLIRKGDDASASRTQVVTHKPEYADGQASAGLLASWNLILYHKRTVLAVMLSCIAAAVLFTKLQSPTYRVHTVIAIEPRNEYFLNLREIDPTLGGDTTETYLNTQTRILQSESMIRKAVGMLKGPVPAQSGLISGLLGRLRAISPTGDRKSATPAAAKASGPDQDVITWIGSNLSANPIHQGQTIELTFDSPDARFGANFLNALSAAFIENVAERRREAVKLTQSRLNEQLAEAKTGLEASENALQDYARDAGLIFTSDKQSTAEDQLRVLEEELAAARADRVAKESLHDIADSSPAASLPPVQDSMTLRDYEAKLVELRQKRAELQATFTDNHPEVKAIQAQIKEMETGLANRRGDVVQRIGNDYEAAMQRETLLARLVARQTRRVANDSEKSVRYNVLQREVETDRTLYDTMLQRASNSWLASAMESPNIHVVDPAVSPTRPFKPRVGENVALGAVGGSVLGMLLVLAGEGRNRRIHSPVDLRSQLDVQQLGVVPYVPAAKAPRAHEDAAAGPG